MLFVVSSAFLCVQNQIGDRNCCLNGLPCLDSIELVLRGGGLWSRAEELELDQAAIGEPGFGISELSMASCVASSPLLPDQVAAIGEFSNAATERFNAAQMALLA